MSVAEQNERPKSRVKDMTTHELRGRMFSAMNRADELPEGYERDKTLLFAEVAWGELVRRKATDVEVVGAYEN